MSEEKSDLYFKNSQKVIPDKVLNPEPTSPEEMMKFLYSFKPMGNVMDSTWSKLITWGSGKPHYEAMALLGDIFYWYRPSVTKDEKGNIKLSKKYRADILQRSYDQIAEMLNMTKKEARTAMEKLEELGVAKREFRTIISSGVKNNNVMFISFYPKRLQELQEKMLVIETEKDKDNSNIYPSSFQKDKGVLSNELGSPFKGTTNTETTTETTTKTSSSSSLHKDNVLEKTMPLCKKKEKEKDFSKALDPLQRKALEEVMKTVPQHGNVPKQNDICAWMLSRKCSTRQVLDALEVYKQDVEDARKRGKIIKSMGACMCAALKTGRKPRGESYELNKAFATKASTIVDFLEITKRYVKIRLNHMSEELEYCLPEDTFTSILERYFALAFA